MLGWLVRPVEGINYNVIMGMYLFFVACGFVVILVDLTIDIDAFNGLYLIFAPFLPATIWCFFVRRRWLAKVKEA